MKKLMILLGIILSIVLLGIIGTVLMFWDEISIIRSITRLGGEQAFYVMDFKDGYHLDEMLEEDISSDGEMAGVLAGYISHGFYKAERETKTHIGCSTLTCMEDAGNMIWGRNFDWYDSVPIIVRATPKDGYASIATCEFANITGDSSRVPGNLPSDFLAVASYYVPMDGVNEKGLCVAILEVNEGGQTIVDTDKKNITVTMAVRMLLDKAASVDEAIALLQKYDICPTGGISSHLSISDRTGRAVAVEFMDGDIKVVETPYVTNFNLYNGDITAGGVSPMRRYNLLKERYDVANGVMNVQQMKEAMETVSQKAGKWKTRWSVIYENSSELKATYFWNAHFEQGYVIGIHEKY